MPLERNAVTDKPEMRSRWDVNTDTVASCKWIASCEPEADMATGCSNEATCHVYQYLPLFLSRFPFFISSLLCPSSIHHSFFSLCLFVNLFMYLKAPVEYTYLYLKQSKVVPVLN
jgi:hypothetical protein